MHRSWANNFNSVIRETRQDALLRNTKFNAQKWDNLFEELSALEGFRIRESYRGSKAGHYEHEKGSEEIAEDIGRKQ
ncbi:hypothetical protein MFLAVUS_007437 [Mucor flavus]|uniref:Uncharacterized protein n=1 Tax=Mucor flavus TaxID=439312 RepID=A0ABP9Z4A2_9FUNG